MLLGTQGVNEQGHLVVGGCDTVELAARFGTPLYVMDERCLRDNCREYQRAFRSRLPDSVVVFAAKAFLNMAMCRIALQEGLWLDLSSEGELFTALEAKFSPQRMLLHGNNKSLSEIDLALQTGVERIVADSELELETLSGQAGARGATAQVLLRVTPGIKPKTHSYIQTGHLDSKFGLGIETGRAMAGVRHALSLPDLKLRGLHCHIGSQLFGLESFQVAARMMVDFLAQVRDQTGWTAEELDLGGGLGVRYLEQDQPPSVDQLAEAMVGALRRELEAKGLPPVRLMVEPGRSIVGEAGLTLYRVGVIKEIPGVRKYAAVDGGMSDNPRPALYQAQYQAVVANKAALDATERITIAGKHCETDVLIWDVELPPLSPGDLLAVQTTGAYNYSMSSNYNRLTRPAVVLVAGGRADVIVERESLQDLVRQDRVPSRLLDGSAEQGEKNQTRSGMNPSPGG